jgi:hypothetical protein
MAEYYTQEADTVYFHIHTHTKNSLLNITS